MYAFKLFMCVYTCIHPHNTNCMALQNFLRTVTLLHATLPMQACEVWMCGGDDVITKRKLQQWTPVSYEESVEWYGRHGHLAVEKKECSAWIYVQYVCHILHITIRDALSTSLVYRSSIVDISSSVKHGRSHREHQSVSFATVPEWFL